MHIIWNRRHVTGNVMLTFLCGLSHSCLMLNMREHQLGALRMLDVH